MHRYLKKKIFGIQNVVQSRVFPPMDMIFFFQNCYTIEVEVPKEVDSGPRKSLRKNVRLKGIMLKKKHRLGGLKSPRYSIYPF